jgi:hypothetical protein
VAPFPTAAAARSTVSARDVPQSSRKDQEGLTKLSVIFESRRLALPRGGDVGSDGYFGRCSYAPMSTTGPWPPSTMRDTPRMSRRRCLTGWLQFPGQGPAFAGRTADQEHAAVDAGIDIADDEIVGSLEAQRALGVKLSPRRALDDVADDLRDSKALTPAPTPNALHCSTTGSGARLRCTNAPSAATSGMRTSRRPFSQNEITACFASLESARLTDSSVSPR